MELEKTITLRKPVKIADQVYDTLSLEEPTAGQIEKAANAGTSVGVMINLIAAVAKVPRAVAERLCQRDLKEAGDFLQQFSEAGPTTGETSSQS